MKKQTLISFLIVIAIIPLLFLAIYRIEVIKDFRSRPVEYLIQYIIMMLPIVVSLIFFYIEKNDRKNEEVQQRKQLEDQKKHQINMQKSLEEMTKVLDTQSSQQEEISKYLLTTATELRRIRLPQAFDFLYRNYYRIKNLLDEKITIQNYTNVVGIKYEMNGIIKEWKEVNSEEVPLFIRREFESTKYFFEFYFKLLGTSCDYLIKISENDQGNLDYFHLALNKNILVIDLISKAMSKMKSLSQQDIEMLNNDEKYMITLYESREELLQSIRSLSKDLETMYEKMEKWKGF